MTFKIPGSEIQRAFAKKAKSKGWSKDDVIQKTASNKQYVYQPSKDVTIDICVLSQALRTKGYEKYADDLDAKIIAFKTAQNSLYRVHDEDGTDMLEFAHPDGDIYIEDADDGLGYLETLLGQHKKILDVVNRSPKTAQVKEAQLKDSLSQYLEKFKFELTLPQVFDLFKKNSGSLYDFVNVYYHDFFEKAYRYVVDASTVYGTYGVPIAQNIVAALQNNPVQYLSDVQKKTGIKTVDLIRLPGDSASSIKDWFVGKEEKIAEEVHRRFGDRYSKIYTELKNVNANINSHFSDIASKINSAQKDPAVLKETLNSIAANGSYKYIYDAIMAFFGQNYADVFGSVFEQIIDEVKDSTNPAISFKERIQATIGRLISAGHLLINSFPKKPALKTKHESTVQAMRDMIQVLESNINSTQEQLLANLPDGIKYDSYDELDKDTIELLEFIKQEVSN